MFKYRSGFRNNFNWVKVNSVVHLPAVFCNGWFLVSFLQILCSFIRHFKSRLICPIEERPHLEVILACTTLNYKHGLSDIYIWQTFEQGGLEQESTKVHWSSYT